MLFAQCRYYTIDDGSLWLTKQQYYSLGVQLRIVSPQNRKCSSTIIIKSEAALHLHPYGWMCGQFLLILSSFECLWLDIYLPASDCHQSSRSISPTENSGFGINSGCLAHHIVSYRIINILSSIYTKNTTFKHTYVVRASVFYSLAKLHTISIQPFRRNK